jgi:outer membrane protein assembly factor BamB
MRASLLISALVAAALLPRPAAAEDWPQFRGGPALSHAAARVPTEWSNESNLAWRTQVPGSGWSQPIVAVGRIYVTTAVSGGNDRPKATMGGVMDFSTMGRVAIPEKPIQWRVLAIDPADGRVLWSKTVVEAKPQFGKHASNTFATETPCASADTVYAFFGATGTLAALDRDGNERWRREFGPQPIINQFGTGSSPVLLGDRIILQLYNEDSAKLLCLDAATGKDAWVAERGKGTSWSTPVIWDNAGTTEVLAAGDKSIIAYALADGAERWRIGGIDTSFACSVVADREGVYFGTSSPGSKAPAAAIAPGHLGDLTPLKGETKTAAVRWSRTKSGAGMPSPVVIGDHLYFYGNTAVCLDKRTGEERFRKRLPGGTTCVGCPLVIGGRIYLVNERGTTVVMQAGPEFKVLGESKIGPGDEVFWATPAVAGDALLIRSSDALYCIRE